MIRKLLFLFVMLIGLAASTAAQAGTIPGPVFTNDENGWDTFGLQLQAITNTKLVSARYPNQGKGTTVELRDAVNVVLFSAPIAVGDTNPVIPINVVLTAGQTYTLVVTTESNSKFAFTSAFPVMSAELSVLGPWGTTQPGPGSAQ